jgi:DNA-binding winged helix-turn-helix (wHTH) protein/tetratricopeptide (TPR) repeat protein
MGTGFFPDESLRGAVPAPDLAAPTHLARLAPFSLGSAEVRPATREVVYGDCHELLEPKVMQVLVALANARGEIMTRDDLIVACWSGLAVSDDAVNRVLSRLRSLAASSGAFRLETIKKVGFRLVETPGAESPGFESPAAAPFRISRRAALASVGAAAVAVAGGGLWTISGRKVDPEVRSLVDEGDRAMDEGLPDDVAHAVAVYRLALQKDPNNADAWGGLSLAYRFQWEFGSPDQSRAMLERARSSAQRALQLKPGNAPAKASLVMMTPLYRHWARAEAEMRPLFDEGNVAVGIRLAHALADTGRLSEALSVIARTAAVRDDVPRAKEFHAALLWNTGRLVEADQALVLALARWPRHVLLWFRRFWFLTYTGRPEAALAFASDGASRPVGVADRVFDIATASARALSTGSATDIEQAAALHRAAFADGTAFAENAVKFLTVTGHLDDAFNVLRAYYFEQGAVADSRFGPETATYMPPDRRQTLMLFALPTGDLRADPRFPSLLRDVGLENYWRETGTIPDYRRDT